MKYINVIPVCAELKATLIYLYRGAIQKVAKILAAWLSVSAWQNFAGILTKLNNLSYL